MAVRSMSRIYELVRTMDSKGKTVHGLWKTVQDGEERLIHMVQFEKTDLARESIPYIKELEENGAFTDLLEVFFEKDSLFLAFLWKGGIPLREYLAAEQLSMEERFLTGKAILEQMLILNFPLFLQCEELEADEILIAPDRTVNFYYGFSDTAQIAGASVSEAGEKAGGLLRLLFAGEAEGGFYPELDELFKKLASGDLETFLQIYQEYLSLAVLVTEERFPPEKKKEPFAARLKKKAGLLAGILKIISGLLVISAAAVLLVSSWKERVYPVVEAAYLTRTFANSDEAVKEYSGKVEIIEETSSCPLFRGRLEDGRRTGYGFEYTRDGGLLYEGNFLADRYDGQGILYSRTGRVKYQGEFLAGSYDGNGSLYDEAGALIYEGGFVKGEMEGEGISRDSEGRLVYEGGFKKGLYDGAGRLYRDDRLVYEGSFRNGIPDGQGVSYEDGRVQENGVFERGVFVEGKGYLYDSDGTVRYSGSIAEGRPDGEGVAYEAGLVVYEGGFKNGEYDGEGKLYSGTGLVYRGGFAGGMYDGEGMLYAPRSGLPVYSGNFRLGRYDGEGMEYDDSGNLRYQGNFLLGARNGYGICYDPATGKTEQEGEFRNGILVTPKEELTADEELPVGEELSPNGDEAGREEDGSDVKRGGTGPAGDAANRENDPVSVRNEKGGPGSE